MANLTNNNTVYRFYPNPNKCETALYAGKVFKVAAIKYEAEREWRKNDAGGESEYSYGGEMCYVNNYYLVNVANDEDRIWFNCNGKKGNWQPSDISGLTLKCEYDRNMVFGKIQTSNGEKIVVLYER